MKTLLLPVIFFTALFNTLTCNAQDEDVTLLTDADWNTLIPYLVEEDFVNAEKISGEFLSRFKDDDEMSDEAGIVRYMYVYSIGGLLGEKEITKEEAEQKLKGFVGKVIITPFNTYKAKGMFNYFSLAEDGKSWKKCVANDGGTVIYAFETYEMDDKLLLENATKYEGKNMRIVALIKSIGTGGFTMPRLEITYSSTEIWDIQDE